MWQFETAGVIKAVRDLAGVEPSTWTCPCGCDNVIVFARNVRALWLAGTLVRGTPTSAPVTGGPLAFSLVDPDPPPSGLPVLGLESAAELEQFIASTRKHAEARGVLPSDVDRLTTALWACFSEGPRAA